MDKKLRHDPIGVTDLIDYLDNHSDFSFEIETLKKLIELGFSCQHGGTYEDPATQTPREYDIRAVRQIEKRFLHLAVECKNLRPNFPLLISCLPRRHEEAFHELSASVDPLIKISIRPGSLQSITPKMAAQISYVQIHRLKNTNSLYPIGEFVGKSCDQIGRSSNGSEIVSKDSGIYNKWSQALSSAHDLIPTMFLDGKHTSQNAASLIFPLVVVPNDRLWCVNFDANGNRVSDPKPVKRCSFFVNRKYHYQLPFGKLSFVISHLEFVTSDGLLDFVGHILSKNAKNYFTNTSIGNSL